jgi:hypothetical protein
MLLPARIATSDISTLWMSEKVGIFIFVLRCTKKCPSEVWDDLDELMVHLLHDGIECCQTPDDCSSTRNHKLLKL